MLSPRKSIVQAVKKVAAAPMKKVAEQIKRAVKDVRKAAEQGRLAEGAKSQRKPAAPVQKAASAPKGAGQGQKKSIVKDKKLIESVKTIGERVVKAAPSSAKAGERGAKPASAPKVVAAPAKKAGKNSAEGAAKAPVRAVAPAKDRGEPALKASGSRRKAGAEPVVAAVGAIGVTAPSAPAAAEAAPQAPRASEPAKVAARAEPAKTAAPAKAPEAIAPKPQPVAKAAAESAAPAPKPPIEASAAGPAGAKKPADGAAGKKTSQRQGFKTQEFIVYPAHGVGQIVAIEEQEVAGYKLELFVISFAKDKMTLRVPTVKVGSVGMRKLAEPNLVAKALDTLKGRARVKRTMWSRRAQEYEAKINSGDIVAISEVVRDLYRSESQPEQSYSERQLYEAALDRLSREIAAVERLTETEAVKQIEASLAKGPRRGPKGTEDAEGDEALSPDEAEAA